ncbi:hypothetical protein HNQ36_004888 [Afipia massiliensis]|uniref:Uncharacterized protein n=1 Tax=Afipia massiliensis TaxID=211460 RepID=A0A840N8D3_9BRAD|nr:hypothetical protein [Afipia massiliensis]MBB5054877.1 hypothetical protein [Afipia massiliensis]
MGNRNNPNQNPGQQSQNPGQKSAAGRRAEARPAAGSSRKPDQQDQQSQKGGH